MTGSSSVILFYPIFDGLSPTFDGLNPGFAGLSLKSCSKAEQADVVLDPASQDFQPHKI